MLSKTPPKSYVSKFVITEDGAWFALYDREFDFPRSIDIISQIYDLDNPNVIRNLDEDLLSGRLVVGTYNPFSGEVFTTSTTERTPYVNRRISEVFGGEGVEL